MRNFFQMLDLPPVPTRWTPERKAEIVTLIHTGLMTKEEAQARYKVSREELEGWLIRVRKGSPTALRVKDIQKTPREWRAQLPKE